MSQTAGVLLAAGAGRRMGRPKALIHGEDGTPWVLRAVQVLRDGGCSRVLVVIGAAADAVAALLPGTVEVVRPDDWAQGMGASLRAGLAAVSAAGCEEAALIALVDMPGMTAAVVQRLAAGSGPAALARAAFDGVPGHPVLIGRSHWAGVAEVARGDVGARHYLAAHQVRLIECGDVGSGADIDTSAGLVRPARRPTLGP
jgi:CTP:molybdopterin cytidylyltransferase MocA